jgi:hypothetical protein
MSTYTVSQIALPPNAAQDGTGTHFAGNWVVDPSTVAGSGLLAFTGLEVEVTTMLFAIADKVVPNWFGVAVPFGISDFTRANLFFHPTPAQAGYNDSDYPGKTGLWPNLFYYMDRLGYQIDGARRNQVLIMPFLTEAAKDTGILPANWRDILTQILVLVRQVFDPSDSAPLALSQLVVSSYSAGIVYSDNFRRTATSLGSLLSEVWDLDGRYSTYRTISEALHSTALVRAIKYDQVPSADTSIFHVPVPRWANYVDKPTSGGDVHGLIRDFMFLHACSITDVGALIPGPAAGTAATHTATGTATATHSATASASTAGTHTATATHSATLTSTGAATTGTTTGTHSATAGGTASGSATHAGTSSLTAGTATHAGTATQSGSGTGPAIVPPARPPQVPAFPPAPPSLPPRAPAPIAPAPSAPCMLYPGAAAPCTPPPPVAPASHHPSPRHAACCTVAVPALVGSTAATAQAAQTALAAIAALSRKRR